MKGYKIEDRLYIFPQTVDVIPEVEGVDVIYVQHETVKAWKEANTEVADKIKGYNFLTITSLPKEWAGHSDDDIEPTQKEDPELAWSADSATVTIGADDNIFPTLTNPHLVTVSYTSSDGEKATIDASTGEITLVSEGNTTISAVFAGDDTYEAQTVTYTLTVQAVQPILYDIVYGGDYSSIITNTNISSAAEGQVLVFEAQSGIDLYNDYVIRVDDISAAPIPVDAPTATNNTLTFTMPDKNAYITITAVQHTYTLTLTGDNILENSFVLINNETVENTGEWEVYENDDIKIVFTESTGTYNTIQAPNSAQSLPDNNGIKFNMPAEDTAVIIDFVDGSSSSGTGPS